MTQDTILNIVFFLIGLGFGMFQQWLAQKDRIADQRSKIGAINDAINAIQQRITVIEGVTGRLVQMELTLGRVDGVVPRLHEVLTSLLKIEKTIDVMEKVAFQPTGRQASATRQEEPAAAATYDPGLATLKRGFARPPRRADTVPEPAKKNEQAAPDLPPSAADLVIDDTRRRVYLERKEIDLTWLEYCVLRCFGQQAGQIVSRETLAEQIRLDVDEQDLERLNELLVALIGSLRKKLGDDPNNPTYLGSVPGPGWILQRATYIPPTTP